MTTNRLEYIDLARAIAVISVIAYHFPCIDQLWGLHTFINTYFLTLFFFLSGWLMHLSVKKQWILKKVMRLLVPLVSFSLIFIPTIAFIKGSSVLDIFNAMMHEDSKGGYWFVYTLFSAMILIWSGHYIYRKLQLPKWAYALILVIPWLIACGLSILLPNEISQLLSISSFRRYYLFILLGMTMQNDTIRTYSMRNDCYVVFCILYIIFIVLSLVKFPCVNSNLSFGVWTLTNIFGCLSIVESCRRICNRMSMPQWIIGLSHDSLGIYLCQFIILRATQQFVLQIPVSPYISFVPYTLALLIITFTITRMMGKYAITSKLFLGQ